MSVTQRSQGTVLLWLVIAAAIVASGYLLYQPFLRVLYPVPYKAEVERYAREHGLDPFLLTAVIRVESSFRSDVISPRGARGLMQVMPDTARWVAARLAMDDFELDTLFEPAVNIRIGAWYLAFLRDEFQGRIVPALAAYNGGRSNVDRWLAEARWSGRRETVEDIPFPETRQYVGRVLDVYDGYRRVYRGEWAAARNEFSWELSLRRALRAVMWWVD